jgi:hypothetical protein
MLAAFFSAVVGALPLLWIGTIVKWPVYLCAPLIGVSIALNLNTGTSLISDVIGNDTKSAAFVYGCYSLLDKFANGFLLYFFVAKYSTNPEALRYIVAFTPLATSGCCAAVTYIGIKFYSSKLK